MRVKIKKESRSSHLKISLAILSMNAMAAIINITPTNAEMSSHNAQHIKPKITTITNNVIISRLLLLSFIRGHEKLEKEKRKTHVSTSLS